GEGGRSFWLKGVWDICDICVDLNRVKSEVWRNANGTSVQSTVGFRPLLGSCITSAVRGSGPVTYRFVTGGIFVFSVYCFTSASQRRSVDTILRLAGAA
ncbi:hypothetical protein HAX54_052152, partial [Datura stramonium]|nr:hypothetical protein [Datura stramonium]